MAGRLVQLVSGRTAASRFPSPGAATEAKACLVRTVARFHWSTRLCVGGQGGGSNSASAAPARGLIEAFAPVVVRPAEGKPRSLPYGSHSSAVAAVSSALKIGPRCGGPCTARRCCLLG